MAGHEATEKPSETAEREAARKRRVRGFLDSDFVRSSPYWGVPFVLMAVAVYGGIGFNVAISLTDTAGLAAPDFSPGNLDLDMYVTALESPAVQQAAQNNFVLLVAFTTISLGLGLFLAILLDRDIRFNETLQTVYLLPMSLSFVVTAQLWLWAYNQQNGLVNLLLTTVGLPRVDWLGNPELSLSAVIFALIWQFSGYTMVVYLAGLRSISTDQFEAGMVDGASTVRIYLRVIIPQLKAASVSAAVVLMIFALKAFTFLYSLTGRYRPPNGTDILATLMVRQAFKFGKFAYAAAIATILLAMALGVIAPYLYYQHRRGSL